MSVGTGQTILASDIDKAVHRYAVDAVGTDSYAITPTPATTAYVAGQMFSFKAGTANTGAATLAVSGLAAKSIKKNVTEDLITGDIIANQIVTVIYDSVSDVFQLISKTPVITPVVRVYKYTTVGSSSTQFDITNPGGTTFRYTYDGNGTDPGISAATFPIGTRVQIYIRTASNGNNGNFVVTGSGSNYFEITNASGTAETNKQISSGFLKYCSNTTWTKPSGLKYAIVEVVGGGGGSGGLDTDATTDGGTGGGGGGGYSKKTIVAATLGSTETLTVGGGGKAGIGTGAPTSGGTGDTTSFGSHLQATGGVGSLLESGDGSGGGLGGIGSGGDINVQGGGGSGGEGDPGQGIGGAGGNSFLGGGGNGQSNVDEDGINGGDFGGGAGGATTIAGSGVYGAWGGSGVIIVTEFY